MRRPYLYRRQRAAARLALYGSLPLVALVAWLLLRTVPSEEIHEDFSWQTIDYESMESVELLREYVRIDTTSRSGSELRGARFLQNLLAREGVQAEVLDMGNGKANLYARIEGERPETLILHHHIDTNDIYRREAWRFDPFAAEIDLPWLFGRGTFDMKSVAIAQLLAVLDLRRQGVPLRRSVVLLGTSSEESSDSDLGSRWLLRNRPQWFRDAWAVLTEGGVVEATTPTDVKYWGTETWQKNYVKVIACSPRRQRLEDLRQDLLDIGDRHMSPRLPAEYESFARAYAHTRENPFFQRLLGDPQSFFDDPAHFDATPRYAAALFRNTISAFPVHERDEGGYSMRLTISLLPGEPVAANVGAFLPPWLVQGVDLHVEALPAAPSSPVDHPVIEAIDAALLQAHGDIPRGPYLQTRSANDSRFFRAAGIPSYGFSPFLVLSSDTSSMGGPNEGITLPAYAEGVGLYRDLLRRLVGGDEEAARNL